MKKRQRSTNRSEQYVHNLLRLFPKSDSRRAIYENFVRRALPFCGFNAELSASLAKLHRSRRKECFTNCALIAMTEPSLAYYEGWACPIIPIEHAWLVNADGEVIDPTFCLIENDVWHNGPVDYFGVRIDRRPPRAAKRWFEPAWLPMCVERESRGNNAG